MKVYVGNLASSIDDSQFKDLVTPFGTPDTVNLIKDRVTGASRGFGFVEFQNDEQAKAAIAGLNGKTVDGKVLKVNESQPKGRQ